MWRSRVARSSAHDWKSCNGQKPFEGSNPSFSATKNLFCLSDKRGFCYNIRSFPEQVIYLRYMRERKNKHSKKHCSGTRSSAFLRGAKPPYAHFLFGILSSQGTPTMHFAQLPFLNSRNSSMAWSLHFFRLRLCSSVMPSTGHRPVQAPHWVQYS